MKNYAEMSDFDINGLVAKSMFGDSMIDFEVNPFPGNCSVFSYETEFGFEHFDGCNSWSDAGPVIEKNRISIEFDLDDQNTATAFNKHYPGWYEKNPLRAAMIAFLMMKDAEK